MVVSVPEIFPFNPRQSAQGQTREPPRGRRGVLLESPFSVLQPGSNDQSSSDCTVPVPRLDGNATVFVGSGL